MKRYEWNDGTACRLLHHSMVAQVPWNGDCWHTGELYRQHLLPVQTTSSTPKSPRYRFVLADKWTVPHPGVIRSLFRSSLGKKGNSTYNPDGGVRLGLGAKDPSTTKAGKRYKIKAAGW